MLFFLILLLGQACTTVPEVRATNLSQASKSDYVSITTLELAQLKDAAMQWQQAREGLERILKLEKEITHLVNYIDIINREITNLPSKDHSSKYVRPGKDVKPQQLQVKKGNNSKKQTVGQSTPKHVFALQVASVDSEVGITRVWKEINIKAAPLFREKILTNIEPVKINDKMYYRLKLGSYQSFKNAKTDCGVLKLYKLDCIVSNYTYKPIKL